MKMFLSVFAIGSIIRDITVIYLTLNKYFNTKCTCCVIKYQYVYSNNDATYNPLLLRIHRTREGKLNLIFSILFHSVPFVLFFSIQSWFRD